MTRAMTAIGLSAAIGLSLSAVTTAANAQQQPAIFFCRAPVGHVCQFAVQAGAAPIAFALPSGERKLVPGLVPYSATYCVCDPGPVTPDCTAPRPDQWCLGRWMAVIPGVNAQIEASPALAQRAGRRAAGDLLSRVG